MITTILLSIFNFFWYGLMDTLWIKQLPYLTIDVYQNAITFFLVSIRPVFQVIDVIIPVDVLSYCAIAIVMTWTIVLGIKIGRFFVNLLKPTAGV